MKFLVTALEPEGDETLVQVSGDGVRGALFFPSTAAPKVGALLMVEIAGDARSRIPPREAKTGGAQDAERDEGASRTLTALLFGGRQATERDVDGELDAFVGRQKNNP